MSKLVFLVLVLALPFRAAAQIYDDSFRSWFWASSIVVENWLYVAGGEVWKYNSSLDTEVPIYDHGTLAIDLTNAWTTDTVNGTKTATPEANIRARRPTFWYDNVNKSINLYGGWPYDHDPNFVPYSSFFPASLGANPKWHARFGDDADVGFSFTRKAGGLVATSDNTYWNLGGFGSSTTDPQFLGLDDTYQFTESGLFSFDNHAAQFTNTTTTFNRIHGEAQFVPLFGEEGVIIYIGGDKPTSEQYTVAAALVPMNTITIYDVKSGKFYDQLTTGTVPQDRTTFCSVGASGPANASYEIYIFGGSQSGTLSQTTQTDMGTVYILSIPSFTWISTNQTSWWRYANHCQIIGKRQMLNIGGVGLNFNDKDNFPSGLGIFDMVDLTWTDTYDPNAKPYTRPDVIQQLYGSNGNPKKTPSWSDDALSSIFKVSASTASPGSSTTPSSSATPTQTSASKGKKSDAGAIAGGVVGGVAFIAALVALGFFLMRRRRQGKKVYHPARAEMDDGSYGDSSGVKIAGTHEMQSGNANHPAELDERRQFKAYQPPLDTRPDVVHEIG